MYQLSRQFRNSHDRQQLLFSGNSKADVKIHEDWSQIYFKTLIQLKIHS